MHLPDDIPNALSDTLDEAMTKLSAQDAEIARLRGELSRAGVREGEAEELIRKLLEHSRGRVGYGALWRKAENYFATPSPLADAAQEVLEAAGEERQVEQSLECAESLAKQAMARKRLLPKREARASAVDRYRALLEGREEG